MLTSAVLALQLQRIVQARRPDLRPAERANVVSHMLAMGDGHVGLDRDCNVRLSAECQALIGSPQKEEPQAATPPADTSALKAELATEENPIRRAQIRERIGIANGITSTRENP